MTTSTALPTAAHLIAEIPAVLGFHPTDSVIFLLARRVDTGVSWVFFLGLCLDFHSFLTGVVFPKSGFDFSRGALVQALVEP